MEKKELIEKLKHFEQYGDTEGAHIEADKALLEYINDSEIEIAYDNIKKWYA